MRVFIAGFQHETNTFAPTPADWAAFNSGSAFPGYCRGEDMLRTMESTSLPMGGFIRYAREAGWTLLPSIWAGATPSATITADAFERLCTPILEDLAASSFDAIYLDLHGAALAEGADDAEGELLRRVRAVVGDSMPIVVSLDLHANVTQQMCDLATAMTAYRCYPHTDMAETGVRAAHILQECASIQRDKWYCHSQRIPFLLPVNAQCTLLDPAASIMKILAQLEVARNVHLSFAMGFPCADFPECGPVVFGYGSDRDAVHQAVSALKALVVECRDDWRLDLLSADNAVERAMQEAATGEKPVVIADTQDNPGGGADANTTGVLRALLRAKAGERFPRQVAVGLIHDPQAADEAVRAGVGATLLLSIGRSVRSFDGTMTENPVTGRCKVLAASDGVIELNGPMTAGSTATLGPCACVDMDGVLLLLSTGKVQMYDLDFYRFLGVEPTAMKILVNKSSVHFRAAFEPVSQSILVAKSPGPMAADPADLPWKRLPASLELRP